MAVVDHTDTAAWLQLIRAEGLGPSGIRRLLAMHGSAPASLAAGPSAWRAAGLEATSIAALQHPDTAVLAADLDWLAAPDRHLLTCDGADFPALLAEAPNPPAALFVEGDPTLLWTAQIAVVGSRNPSAAGCDNAAEFTRALVAAGMTITSGLAEGIDAVAHRTALAGNGATVAVMGTGPDRIYPAKHRRLADEIAERGVLVTEFPPGTGARRDHFPRRNRIVAALSLGTLVVEAALQSGALISARLASEAGREVFAIPGSIHNPLARGCHRLIRDGAALVESADEVIAAVAATGRLLGERLRSRLRLSATTASAPSPAMGDPDYDRLWSALSHDPRPLERIVQLSGLTIETLSSMLLVMELDGRVAAANGRYARRGS